MKIFIICPVRSLSAIEANIIKQYITYLEKEGHEVYYPPRDTDQQDDIGLSICFQNLDGIRSADRVDIFWTEKSRGSLFDFGMVFALGKSIKLVNPNMVKRTQTKSFANVLLTLSEE